ncbi:GNAT family N-acetyltransferase [Streptomyces sp. DSM 42041]|uniref:GNAT family N-acetyltransferase n=1 Tax=Streptomyces hazeniae TaxID=3075538 RepID=A0ABU2NKY5_9ACTN|nr:GNAT family N-acetyltransferase [Streptomyces sp. DSM 42041]MDT0377656.1 GNAT family N-acetyltransferase [Streptomyces sp. DSM 42041]
MQILTFPEASTPPGLRAQVRALQDTAWPSSDGRPTPRDATVHDPALHPLSMLLVEDGRVLAALDVLTKELRHAGRTYRAAGLSTVVTRQDVRGRGHGRRLAAAGRAHMAEQALDVGLFTCDPGLRPFYESAGWEQLPGTVLIGGTPDSPFPSDRPGFVKVTMAAFFSAEARRARSDFTGARIELYPGRIDCLW